jgi:hypothetical protein
MDQPLSIKEFNPTAVGNIQRVCSSGQDAGMAVAIRVTSSISGWSEARNKGGQITVSGSFAF